MQKKAPNSEQRKRWTWYRLMTTLWQPTTRSEGWRNDNESSGRSSALTVLVVIACWVMWHDALNRWNQWGWVCDSFWWSDSSYLQILYGFTGQPMDWMNPKLTSLNGSSGSKDNPNPFIPGRFRVGWRARIKLPSTNGVEFLYREREREKGVEG